MEETYSLDVQKNCQSPKDENLSGYDEQFNMILTEGKKNKELLSVALGKTSVWVLLLINCNSIFGQETKLLRPIIDSETPFWRCKLGDRATLMVATLVLFISSSLATFYYFFTFCFCLSFKWQ